MRERAKNGARSLISRRSKSRRSPGGKEETTRSLSETTRNISTTIEIFIADNDPDASSDFQAQAPSCRVILLKHTFTHTTITTSINDVRAGQFFSCDPCKFILQ